MDVLLGGALAVVATPVVAVSAAAVAVTSGRPVFFSQTRAGRDGAPFQFYKLRTMREGPELEGRPEFDAERITNVGRLLRATSIDELPQLLNVLKGDMSLVGPRPLLVQYLTRYSPEQARRHEVLPGITGWAQVCGRNAIAWEAKFKMDLWYVDNWSPWLDVRILALTATKVFKREGVSSEGHVTMPEFLGTPETNAAVQ